jgi:transcriptional regulator with XRE-family HTH domain
MAGRYRIFRVKQGNVVGGNIRRIRLAAGLTQEQLALESGLSQGYINQLENGGRKFTQKTLELIADALSVPMIEFFREEGRRAVPLRKKPEKRERPPDRRQFLALLKKLPDHVVEHYFDLLKLESEVSKRRH